MKNILCNFLFFALLFCGCRHADGPAPKVPVTKVIHEKTVADLMVGAHKWHGTYAFDGHVNILSDEDITIAKRSDMMVNMSGYMFSGLDMTYASTDSLTGKVTFINGPNPPKLYYNYKTGVINIQLHQAGVHSDDLDIYTP